MYFASALNLDKALKIGGPSAIKEGRKRSHHRKKTNNLDRKMGGRLRLF